MFRFKKIDPEFFRFSKSERTGIYALLVLIALVILVRWGFQIYSKQSATPLAVKHQEFIAWVEADSAKEDHVHVKKTEVEKFIFDPNMASEEELLQLGFKPWLAKNLIKYRSKGGKFKKADDLLKLYGMDSSFYAALRPYVSIPSQEKPIAAIAEKQEVKESHKAKYAPLMIEINVADTGELKRLPGIGSVLASRIVGFRSSLGGFCTISQLEEIYGLPKETIEKIQSSISIDINLITKIDINQVDLSTLTKHPYFRTGVGKRIINYRKQHGKFKNTDEVKNAGMIENELWQKIVPYLYINQ